MNKFESYYAEKYEFKNLELSLSRINDALNEVKFTQSTLDKIIHIAGTNGKGSTSYFLYQMLQNAGYKTALFTSPHILKINERIVFNGKEISDDELNNIFVKHEQTIINNNLSYFEAIFFIAVIFFSTNTPDFTILETGMGGRYDATNTALINEKLCVITSMGYDHAAYLGNNIYSIINEKLGIIRENSHVILAYNNKTISSYISKHLSNKLEIITKDIIEKNNNYPYPYNENYTTAKIIYKTLLNKDFSDSNILRLPPCRMEVIGRIILDGSHNLSGIIKLKEIWKNYNIECIIFTVTNDRDFYNTIKILKTICNNIIVTTLPNNMRSIENFKSDEGKFIPLPDDAFDYALQQYNGNILVTGSFYLCAYMKEYIKRCNNE